LEVICELLEIVKSEQLSVRVVTAAVLAVKQEQGEFQTVSRDSRGTSGSLLHPLPVSSSRTIKKTYLL
jgi:hypothetical protein